MGTITALLDDFLVRAALAAIGVALAAGLLGCFVVWRRMAYFGDATAHAAILGGGCGLGVFDFCLHLGRCLGGRRGALLITALLIIPAAAARGIMRTPEGMALVAMGFAGLSALGGLRFAVVFSTQVGPSIVCMAIAIFVLATIGGKLRRFGT